MMGALIRKSRQLATDPVLRRFLLDRALGRVTPPPSFVAGRPPYLGPVDLVPPPGLDLDVPDLDVGSPQGPITLALPGVAVTLAPGEEETLMRRPFADTETLLGLHRFSWLPLADDPDPAWVAALWRAWARVHGSPDKSWAWHPYTAAERVINLIEFARRSGLPGPRAETIALLARHGTEIAARLEYFGEHHTGNHMANNGRGLALLGLALGWRACADMGFAILVNEAERIFRPSGVLREDSSHYHLLLTRGYASAWLAAHAAGRAEAAVLERVVRRALAVAPVFTLPGGFALVGDVSPDCPPDFLAGLLPGAPVTGWTARLREDERAALAALHGPVDAEGLRADGWLRAEFGPWAGLWHAARDGWLHMPGHGHQDLGAAELHWRGVPVVIDLGRGAYGESGAAALYRSAWAHGGLTIDGADPYPPNKPYYDASFRRRIGGEPPRLTKDETGVTLVHHGYGRLGAPEMRRRWHFAGDRLTIADAVTGHGRHRIERRLPTPWPAERVADGIRLTTPAGPLVIRADAPLTIEPAIRWHAYGAGIPAAIVVARAETVLPWAGTLTVEPT